MGKFILTQMAAVAELGAGLIGECTPWAALAVAKQRGVRLGVTGAEILAPKYRAEAKARSEELARVIRELQRDGYSVRSRPLRWQNAVVHSLIRASVSNLALISPHSQAKAAKSYFIWRIDCQNQIVRQDSFTRTLKP
jgi:hypothetical protein